MENLLLLEAVIDGYESYIQRPSHIDALIEKLAETKEKYGDGYPIILYEPTINCEDNEVLQGLIEKSDSIHVFTKFKEAFKFVQSLGISFILIVSKDFEEQTVLHKFGSGDYIFGHGMLDFEEESFLNEIFPGNSDQMIKSLGLKAYVFCTQLDCETEVKIKEDEEKEVILMGDIQDTVKEFWQEFILIWYDPDKSPKMKKNLEEKIEMKIEEENTYANFVDLHERIKSYSGAPYHLIMSRSNETETIVNEIDKNPDLLGLYIYCKNFEKEKKIDNEKVEIRNTIEELAPRIKEGIRTRSKIKNSLPVFVTNFDISDRSGIYKLHYYLKGLINFHNRKQAKGDFIKLAQKIYQDNDKELARFEKTYNEYSKTEILWWYTKNSPVYKLINNCLRIATSDSILYCRLILKDLERAIREQYQEKSKGFSGEVFRGTYISTEEWEKLQKNIGQEIEMYGFLSTSVNQQTAMKFLRADPKNKILIKIIIPSLPELDEQGFADISEFSEYKQEKEILFNVRSRFRILEAGDHGTKCRQLILLYGAHLLRRHMTKKKPSIKIELELPNEIKCWLCGSKEKLFGYKQEETVVNCLECLIEKSLPKDIPLIALEGEKEKRIERVFSGKIFTSKDTITFGNSGYKCHFCEAKEKDKYYKWMSCDGKGVLVQCSGCLKENKSIENQILISESNPYAMWQEEEKRWETMGNNYQGVLSQDIGKENQGHVYMEVQDFHRCIEYGKKVVVKLKNKRRREQFKLSSFYTLGEAFHHLGEHQQARKCFTKCLGIIKLIDGEESSDGAALYCKLSMIHQQCNEHQEARNYFEKAIDIHLSVDGEDHLSTAVSYENLAKFYQRHCKHKEAFEYFEKALKIKKSLLGEEHPQVASGYDGLSNLSRELGKYEDALKYCNISLEIRESIYGEQHGDTSMSYRSIGDVYSHLGEYQKALHYLKKALKIQILIFGAGCTVVSGLYDLIAGVYQSLGQNLAALEYWKKALDIERAINGEKHPDIAASYHSLGVFYSSQHEYQKAPDNFIKSIEINKSLGREQTPNTMVSYKSLAAMFALMGDQNNARVCYEKAMEIQAKISLQEHS